MQDFQLFIHAFFKDFITILGEMAPYLLLGFFFAGVLKAFVPQRHISRYFGAGGWRSSFNASLLGVPLPLCSCGVIPTGMSFYKNGASKGSTTSFLISTPQTGVDSVLVTYSLLGLPFAIIRPIIAFVTGVFGGWLTDKLDKEEPAQDKAGMTVEPEKAFGQKVKEVFSYGFVTFLQDISQWLIIGLVLAGVISALIPDDFFSSYELPLVVQMLVMLVISIPLYVCATASVPLAAILILKGLSPGAALVLLMAGPATNAATITMIGKVLGKKTLFTYLSSIIGGALLFGFIIDAFLPSEWFMMNINESLGHAHHHGMGGLQILGSFVLVALIVNGYIQAYRTKVASNNKHVNNTEFMALQTLKVSGMSCNHCKANVENNLKQFDFIDEAEANIATGEVRFSGDEVDLAAVKDKINGLGYKVEE